MKRVIRIGTKLWFAKKNDGFDPRPGWRGVLGHLCAVSTHHINRARRRAIRESGTPLLVVGASEDHLVKTEMGSQVLERELRPVECLIMESGHGVNVEKASELNAALLSLFEASETTPARSSL